MHFIALIYHHSLAYLEVLLMNSAKGSSLQINTRMRGLATYRFTLRYVTRRLFRQVYIKIINYSDSISGNLNNTIQTKQHAMKKLHSYSNRNKIYKGLFFVVEGF